MSGRDASPNREPASAAPVFSWRRPWWLVVLGAMLGFGLLQEQSKIKVNHYLRVGDAQQFWDDDAPTRTTWWDTHAPVGRHNFYVSRATWPFFHSLTRSQLVAFKWGLSAAILLLFFVLDVLFLRATGVPERVPWLVLIYFTAGIPMVGLGFSTPGEPWYAPRPRHARLTAIAAPLRDGGACALVPASGWPRPNPTADPTQLSLHFSRPSSHDVDRP